MDRITNVSFQKEPQKLGLEISKSQSKLGLIHLLVKYIQSNNRRGCAQEWLSLRIKTCIPKSFGQVRIHEKISRKKWLVRDCWRTKKISGLIVSFPFPKLSPSGFRHAYVLTFCLRLSLSGSYMIFAIHENLTFLIIISYIRWEYVLKI